MTTSILINALGQALFESCGQALLIYVALQLFMQFFPGIGSKYRYDINYLGLTIICCWFLANLVNIYMHNASAPHYNNLLLYSGNMAYGAKHAPTLLQQAQTFITTYAKYITGLYMIGLLLHAFRLLGGFVHIHHIRKQNNLSQHSLWSAKAHELANKLKIVKKVTLYFSAHIDIPLTIGYLKPIIIFPLALINNLSNDQVEAILLHELAHIKRHDYLLNILQCIMETILCFNPFVWLISKTIREQREYCCDDMVVDEDCNNFTYAKALFIIAQQNNQNYALAMASTGTKKYPLLNRIKRLNTMQTTDSLPKFNLLIIIAIAGIGALLAWGIPQYSAAKTTPHKMPKTIVHLVNKAALSAPVIAAPAVAPVVAPAKVADSKPAGIIYADTATSKPLNDTTIDHSKSKFKIVLEDDKGNKKEYNSVDEMPEPDRKEFLKENPSFKAFNFKFNDSLRFATMEKFKMSPEWKKQMEDMKLQGEKMRKQFNSPEWKKQMADMQKKMHEQFDSPEWKKQMEDMKAQMHAQFDSPEWKKQMEDMKENMHKQFDNPEFKKQMEDMKAQMHKQFDSPEWKKQMRDIRKQSEDMRKKMNDPKFKKERDEMREDIKKEAEENRKKAEQDSTKSVN